MIRSISCILIGICLLRSASAAALNTVLIGTWKSNKELTTATVRLDVPLPPEKRAKFEDLFGKMVVTYTDAEMVTRMPAMQGYPESVSSDRYHVVAESGDRVSITSYNPLTKSEETWVLHFEGLDRYWIDLSSVGGIQGVSGREYFDRIAPPTSDTDTGVKVPDIEVGNKPAHQK